MRAWGAWADRLPGIMDIMRECRILFCDVKVQSILEALLDDMGAHDGFNLV